jgi:hypothetical protein
MYMLRYAIAALCPRVRCTYGTASIIHAYIVPVADFILAIFAPEGSAAIIRKIPQGPRAFGI